MTNDKDAIGIDVSKWQNDIDWTNVKKSLSPEINYVYIKATEGASLKDAKALQNGQGAKLNGLKFGYYHFARPDGDDARTEAKFFASFLKSLPKGNLMPVLDFESNDKKLSPDIMAKWVKDFRDEMKSLGFPELVMYSYKPFLNDNLPTGHNFGDMPLWLAAYSSIPPTPPKGWDKINIWQYTDKGKISGISGTVDMNKAAPDMLTIVGLSSSLILIIIFISILLLSK